MRIMLDTNVLISGFAFGSTSIREMTRWISQHHQLVLSSYIIEELREVIARKAPSMRKALDDFLLRLPFEMCYTPESLPDVLPFSIRDPDDVQVLYSAMVAEVDIFVTGDKDFSDVGIEKPQIMTPEEFKRAYINS